MPKGTIWGFKKQLSDGKYHNPIIGTDWPGYAESDEHPFLTIDTNTYPSNEWCFGDNQENLEKNLKTAPQDWKYRTKKIYYKLNNSGYRTYEWNQIDWKNSIVLLGCSNTFGISVGEDETISYFLEANTNRQVVNLGYPGGSNDIILYNSSVIIEKFEDPYAVIVNWSTLDRFRYYHKFNYVDIGPWNNNIDGQTPNTIIDDVNVSDLYGLISADRYNSWMRNFSISKACSSMWKGRSKYITFSFFNESAHAMRADTFLKFVDRGRDLIHPGSESMEEAANWICSMLEK
jgi:hypothetical protein